MGIIIQHIAKSEMLRAVFTQESALRTRYAVPLGMVFPVSRNFFVHSYSESCSPKNDSLALKTEALEFFKTSGAYSAAQCAIREESACANSRNRCTGRNLLSFTDRALDKSEANGRQRNYLLVCNVHM